MTWDAAMSLREDIIDVLGDTCCFVIAALLFPDMEPDPAIVAEAKRSNVHVLWGTDNLMNRLAAIAARKAYYPPNADDIRREVAAVTDGQIAYAGEAPGASRKPRRFPSWKSRPAASPLGMSTPSSSTRRPAPSRTQVGTGNPGARPGSGTPHPHGRLSPRDGRPCLCQLGELPTTVSRTGLPAPRSLTQRGHGSSPATLYPEHPRALGPFNGHRRGDDFHPAQPAKEKLL